MQAVRAQGLGKRYRVGAPKHDQTFRESLAGLATRPIARVRGGRPSREEREQAEHIWALSDVSLSIDHGETVGLIGRNGAGKTTLLKILSRITKPTTGRAEITGSVGSLLEVGTGFHYELSGRENIYLNGAILGMSRADVVRKFDEIVEFAEVERFIDVPLKRYSTGMQMRLAFSVAAALQPEILLIDEVLAVGDANFQRKCLRKMEEVDSEGRTIIFVSHNASAVLRLCRRVILLEKGRVIADGPSADVMRRYLDSGAGRSAERTWPDPQEAPGDAIARLRAVRVLDALGNIVESSDIREPVKIEVEYDQLDPRARPSVNLHFFNDEGVCLFIANDSVNTSWQAAERGAGMVRCSCRIPGNLLAEGTVFVHAALSTYNPLEVHAFEPDAVAFYIVDQMSGLTARGEYVNELPGVMRPLLEWDTEYLGAGSRAVLTER
jgi:lipopolysaccharide transport system ATP-binding protein